jgi:hypothetical protein
MCRTEEVAHERQKHGIELLGDIPLDAGMCQDADHGKPTVVDSERRTTHGCIRKHFWPSHQEALGTEPKITLPAFSLDACICEGHCDSSIWKEISGGYMEVTADVQRTVYREFPVF